MRSAWPERPDVHTMFLSELPLLATDDEGRAWATSKATQQRARSTARATRRRLLAAAPLGARMLGMALAAARMRHICEQLLSVELGDCVRAAQLAALQRRCGVDDAASVPPEAHTLFLCCECGRVVNAHLISTTKDQAIGRSATSPNLRADALSAGGDGDGPANDGDEDNEDKEEDEEEDEDDEREQRERSTAVAMTAGPLQAAAHASRYNDAAVDVPVCNSRTGSVRAGVRVRPSARHAGARRQVEVLKRVSAALRTARAHRAKAVERELDGDDNYADDRACDIVASQQHGSTAATRHRADAKSVLHQKRDALNCGARMPVAVSLLGRAVRVKKTYYWLCAYCAVPCTVGAIRIVGSLPCYFRCDNETLPPPPPSTDEFDLLDNVPTQRRCAHCARCETRRRRASTRPRSTTPAPSTARCRSRCASCTGAARTTNRGWPRRCRA